MDQEENVIELKISQANLGHLKELLSSLVLADIEQNEAKREIATWLKARKLLDRRRKRAAFFAPAMFGEAPWDILLTLFASSESTLGLSVNRLAEKSGVPASSCKRWLEYLEQEQLVCRRGHETDQRMTLIALTQRGRERMTNYLETFVN
jgi:DNA-binding MarR family transcriptional regulator